MGVFFGDANIRLWTVITQVLGRHSLPGNSTDLTNTAISQLKSVIRWQKRKLDILCKDADWEPISPSLEMGKIIVRYSLNVKLPTVFLKRK